MTKEELFETAVEEELTADVNNIYSHALWMARLMTDIHNDPAFRKLRPEMREQIEQICAAVE